MIFVSEFDSSQRKHKGLSICPPNWTIFSLNRNRNTFIKNVTGKGFRVKKTEKKQKNYYLYLNKSPIH